MSKRKRIKSASFYRDRLINLLAELRSLRDKVGYFYKRKRFEDAARCAFYYIPEHTIEDYDNVCDVVGSTCKPDWLD